MGVFDTSRCPVPDVPSISALPAIVDCGVPPAPPSALDCPDLELSIADLGAQASLDGIPGPAGVAGPLGPPGNDGGCQCGHSIYRWNGSVWLRIFSDCPTSAVAPTDPGIVPGQQAVLCCPPTTTLTATAHCVASLIETFATATLIQTGNCDYQLNLFFGLYCPPGYLSVVPPSSSCGEGVSPAVVIQFENELDTGPLDPVDSLTSSPNPGCCSWDITAAGNVAKVKLLTRTRYATATARWQAGDFFKHPPTVEATDDITGDAITIVLPMSGFQDPNVQAGDRIAYLPMLDCRNVAVNDYQDCKIRSVKMMSWTEGKLASKTADLTRWGWEPWEDIANLFPLGHGGAGNIDDKGHGVDAGDVGGRKTHDGGSDQADHHDHDARHSHTATVGFASLAVGGEGLIETSKDLTGVIFIDPVTGTDEHVQHFHQIYFTATAEGDSGDGLGEPTSAWEGLPAGLCGEPFFGGSSISTSLPAATDCVVWPGFHHDVLDPKHSHFLDALFVALKLRIEPGSHDHEATIQPPNELYLKHSEENHVPPYKALIFLYRTS